jgi:putative NADH-flavin reductase
MKKLRVLVLGASGATGRLVLRLLLERGVETVAYVRNHANIPKEICEHPQLQVQRGEVSDLSVDDYRQMLINFDVMISCLGHRLSFKGVFGAPRDLVTQAMHRAVQAIESFDEEKQTKLILMNTSGNSNRKIQEDAPWSQRAVIGVLRHILPPHRDNERASDVLIRSDEKGSRCLEWVVVRPDQLIDEMNVTAYEVCPSPMRNVIFDSGKTSRINVADFMVRLCLEPELWGSWKGRMPVLYNEL